MLSLDRIVLRLHEASLQPRLWPTVMHELSDLFGGRPLLYGVQWLPSGMSFMNHAHLPTEIVEKIVARYSNVSSNPVMRAALPTMKLHQPVAIDALVPPDELRQTEYYRETIGQLDGIVGDLAVASSISPTRLTVLVLARTATQSPAGTHENDMLTRLSPHLGLAMEVMVRMGRLSAAYHALDQVLCRVAQPVALLDSGGALLFANPALEDLASTSDALEVRAGRLHARSGQQDVRLQHFTDALVQHKLSERHERSILINGRDGGPTIGLIGQPVQSEFAANLDLGETRAIVFVSHLNSMRNDLIDALGSYFRLSERQAAVVGLILDGLSGPEMANRLGITANTLKTHIQRIYEKTDTQSREELFRRMISVAAQTPRVDL